MVFRSAENEKTFVWVPRVLLSVIIFQKLISSQQNNGQDSRTEKADLLNMKILNYIGVFQNY